MNFFELGFGLFTQKYAENIYICVPGRTFFLGQKSPGRCYPPFKVRVYAKLFPPAETVFRFPLKCAAEK